MTILNNHHLPWLRVVITVPLIILPSACSIQSNRLIKAIEQPVKAEAKVAFANRTYQDVQALVNMGPRVAGTPTNQKASAYLVEQYRQAGYKTIIQTFTYSRYEDVGSNLIIDGTTIEGHALKGSVAGQLQAPLVVVPNFGTKSDFQTVNVQGAIAIVKRGEIRFSEKARNALNQGAIGLIIFNNKPGSLQGTVLGEGLKIPVLGISGEQGNNLIDRAQKNRPTINLNLNAENRLITGRNVIAHLEGVTQPKIIVGGHFDSVKGAPGANDNASGTAVVLSIARQVANSPIARQTWFIAFDGEEDGLHGSKAFVNNAQPDFLKKLKAMLNFDMVGVNKQLQIGGTPSLTALAQVVEPKLQSFGSSHLNGASDHASFAAQNIPILFFHRGIEPNYHTPNDKTVDPKLLDETTQAGLDILKRLL